MSGELQALAAFPWGKTLLQTEFEAVFTDAIGGLGKNMEFCCCLEQIHDLSAIQYVGQSLYWLYHLSFYYAEEGDKFQD